MSAPRASIAQMREEMRRIADVLILKNQAYLKREAELIAKYGDGERWVLLSQMDQDHALNKASASAKTCAALVAGLSACIVAELAVQQHLAEYGWLPD